MNTIEAFAPAKLNLFLHVIGKRADGYHDLQSVFTLINFGDTLRIQLNTDGRLRRVNAVPGVPEESDLIIRAAHALRKATDTALGANFYVEKRTPMGGGLGGGSSDAAATLLVLNRLWKLALPDATLRTIGLRLGADVPFFLAGHAAFVEGVGERLTRVDLPSWWYTVLVPNAHVPTPTVFGHPELTRNTNPIKIADFSADGLANLRNDLQPVVLKAFPEVSRALNALGAVSQKSVFGARMTGSGACVFAAFETESAAREALMNMGPEHQGFVAQGLARHPLCT